MEPERQEGAAVRVPPPLVVLLSIGLGLVLSLLWGPLPLPLGRTAQLLMALFLVAGGVALGASALRLFVRSGQDPVPWRPSPALIGAGPYRFTRNPMYLGFMAFQMAVGLLFGNLWIALLAPLSLTVIHFTAVLPEEAYLERQFGEAYRQYCARVRRYL